MPGTRGVANTWVTLDVMSTQGTLSELSISFYEKVNESAVSELLKGA